MADSEFSFDEDPSDGDVAGDSPPPAVGGSLDFGVVGGVVFAFAAIIVGLYLEGSSVGRYFGPSAGLIVFGGTLGATCASVGWAQFKEMPKLFARAFTYASADRGEAIETLVRFAEKARREGLLVLEDDLRSTPDEFLRRGVQLVVDGTDPELVKDILETEVGSLEGELEQGSGLFITMGGFAPTLGIIGTVIGLVLVLSNIADPSSLAASIAVAFIATLYGVGSANLIWLPIGNRLKVCANDQVAGRELMIEGILAIQSGDNPRIVEEKLIAFLSSRERMAYRIAKQAPNGGDIDLDLAA